MDKLLIVEPDGFPEGARKRLAQYFDVKAFDERSLLPEQVADVIGLFVRLKHKIDAKLLSKSRKLRFVATPTTGLTHIDLLDAERRNVVVLSLKGEDEFLRSIHSTAELAWGLALCLVRKIRDAVASVNCGGWNRYEFVGSELRGKSLGIIGFGRLGQIVSRYGLAFGMKVWVNDIDYPVIWPEVERRPLEEIFESCDVISIHVPANERTSKLIGRELLDRMKPSAVIINTSRGDVIDEEALADVIAQSRIGGAGLDVLNEETGGQIEGSRRLRALASLGYPILITPHIGGATDAIPKVEEFLADKIIEWWKLHR